MTSQDEQQRVLELLLRHEGGEFMDDDLTLLCATVVAMREQNKQFAELLGEYAWKPLAGDCLPGEDEAVVLLFPDGGLELVAHDEDRLVPDGTLWMQLTTLPDDHPAAGKAH